MKPTQPSSHKLDRKLAAYTAAGVALAASAVPSGAKAEIIYSGPLTLAVPNNVAGIYLDLVTGTTNTSFFTGYDINPYGSGSSGLTLLAGAGASYVAPAVGDTPSALLPGAYIGSADFFTSNSTATNFKVTGTEFLGIKFVNTATGGTDYGWIQFQTTSATGFPATILGYAYNNTTGDPILAGQTTAAPEPGVTAILGLGALGLGAAGVRRWRRSKQALA